MYKEILLHEAESGREIGVNALTVKTENIVNVGDWKEYISHTSSEINSCQNVNKLSEIKWTPIRWKDGQGRNHFAKVLETPQEINEMLRNI